MAAVEREVKLGAWAGLVLPDMTGVVEGATSTDRAPLRLTATYYDTADLRLARWGVTVRHRAGEDTSQPWTVKLPAEGAPEHGLSRTEVTFAGSETRPPAALLHLVAGLCRGAPLASVAKLRTDRFRRRIADAGGQSLAEIDDDEVSVLVGRRLAGRFREIEVELGSAGGPAVLAAVVERLQAAGAGEPDPTPKVVRALGPRALEAPDVTPRQVRSGATAGEAVTAAIAASVERLFRHDPGVRLGEDAEAVHQARVATRRLRSDLRTFATLLDPAWTRDLRDELGWLADLLGDVHDTDVLLERLHAHAEQLPDSDIKAANVLIGKLARHRTAARTALLDALGTPRYAHLLDRLVEASLAPRWQLPTELSPALPPAAPGLLLLTPSPSPATPSLTTPASASASAPTTSDAPAHLRPDPQDAPAGTLPHLVVKSWRHLQKSVDALGDPPADDDLHQVRIRAKRCRYAAEAVAPVAGKKARVFAAAVADLQTVLGDFHDAVVAEEWLRTAASRAPAAQALVAGEIIAIERGLAEDCRRAWRDVWKKASARKLRAWFD